MASGGDARIVLDRETGTNRYFSGPYTRKVIAYASSTANDLSAGAQDYLDRKWTGKALSLGQSAVYQDFLDAARSRIKSAYQLSEKTKIAISPSGTDLEYIALLAMAEASNGIMNILVGGDEVGSGCIHSAAGEFFALETALGLPSRKGLPVKGLPSIALTDIPVRNENGEAFDSTSIAAQMHTPIKKALSEKRKVLLHIVHGSKTGLILPRLDEIDSLREQYGQNLHCVVDACQARITRQAIDEYLSRGMMVMLTGSKFMGGPPFSGFMLIPASIAAKAPNIAEGMANIFRRAEFPGEWPGRDILPDGGNIGLALRLDASLYELERFLALDKTRRERVIDVFNQLARKMAGQIRGSIVDSAAPLQVDEVATHPLEMQTLLTYDLCHDAGGNLVRELDFDDARLIHKELVEKGIRLGQPVRCVRLPDKRWGATLRVGLSMPQITTLASQDFAKVISQELNDIAKALNDILDEKARVG